MIIFTSVNLKEILKKRRVIRGNVRTDVLIVMRLKSGDTGMYLLILMELQKEFGLSVTDVRSAARLSDYVPKDSFPDFKPL